MNWVVVKGKVRRSGPSAEDTPYVGSYGLNGSLTLMWDARWLGMSVRQRFVSFDPRRTPLLLDCLCPVAQPHAQDAPPEVEGALNTSGFLNDMKCVCLNRHEGGVNSLFLDASVREIGLKELWALNWYPGFPRWNLWTKAGGVQPEDWPTWMRGFKDY